jgi:hypothetical protein
VPVERSGFVALFDALGTRGAWKSRPMAEIITERDEFETLAQASASAQGQQLYKEIIPNATGLPAPDFGFRLESFSDSFILTFWSTEPPRQMINHLANELIGMYDFGIVKRLLFRGAISYGAFCQGTRSLVGPAVDEAYAWSGLARWAGILCTPTARKVITDAAPGGKKDLQGEFAWWPVPLAGGSAVDTWALWWPRTGKRKSLVELFLDPPVSTEVENKMANTLKFYDWATEQFAVGVAGEP